MGRKKEVLALLLFVAISLSNAEIFYNIINKQDDPCAQKCNEGPLPLLHPETDPGEKFVKASCQRGCRFYNLVDLGREFETNYFNNSLDACKSTCSEAYLDMQNMIACTIGCSFMANQRAVGLTSLFSIAIHIEDGIRPPNVLLNPNDLPDNEILSDPVLRKEALPGWWYSNGFKLPETYFKTIPIDSGTVDYGVSSEYLGENEKAATPGTDWLECASRHTGIPRWLLILSIATAALSALWLYLFPEKSTDSVEKITLVKPSIPCKVELHLPDEVPLHKKPPPKYDEVVDTSDPNLQV